MHVSCFKQLSLNIKQKFQFWYHSNEGEKVLPVDAEVVSFKDYLIVFLKCNKAVEVFSKVVIHHY